MKGTMLTLLAAVALLLGAASLQAAAGTDVGAAGLGPGTWTGTGTLEGALDAGRGAVAVSGPVRFRLRVDEKLRVVGQGSWRLRTLRTGNLGYGPVEASVKGWAALAFSGTSRTVSLSGTQYVIGEVTGPGLQWPLRGEKLLDGRLALTSADPCKLAGSAMLTAGVTFRWSATHHDAVCGS